MLKNTKVKLEKLDQVQGAQFQSGVSSEWKHGQENPAKSLPVGYSLEGVLLEDVILGRSLYLYRTKRNDVETSGLTETSPITNIQNNYLHTKNSIYRITELE